MRDERFLHESFKKYHTRLSTIVNKSAKNIPTVGIIHSQLGNILFPTWEQFIPLMEMPAGYEIVGNIASTVKVKVD